MTPSVVPAAKPPVKKIVKKAQTSGKNLAAMNDEERRDAAEASEATEAAAPKKRGRPKNVANIDDQRQLDALISEIKQKTARINAHATEAMNASVTLIRTCGQFRDATGDERESLQGDGLAEIVKSIEALLAIETTVKSIRKATMQRGNGTFGFEPVQINKLLKERRIPQVQLELDLKVERTALDKMHQQLRNRGLLRPGDEKKEKAAA